MATSGSQVSCPLGSGSYSELLMSYTKIIEKGRGKKNTRFYAKLDYSQQRACDKKNK